MARSARAPTPFSITIPDDEGAPAPPSPRRTQPANATAKPGLPDKPAPRRTPAQKEADKQHAQHIKEVKKASMEKAYQQLGNLEEEMAASQAIVKGLGDLEDEVTVVPATVKGSQAPVRPKPRLVPRPVVDRDEPQEDGEGKAEVTRTSKPLRVKSADHGDSSVRLRDAINKAWPKKQKEAASGLTVGCSIAMLLLTDSTVFFLNRIWEHRLDDKKVLLARRVKNWASSCQYKATPTSHHSNPAAPLPSHSSKDAMEQDILDEENDSQERGYAIQHGTWIMPASDASTVEVYDELNSATGTEEAMAHKTPTAIQNSTRIAPAIDVDGYGELNVATQSLKQKHAAEDDGDTASDFELDTEVGDTEDLMMDGPRTTAQTSLMVIEPTPSKTTKAKKVVHLKSISISASGSSVGGDVAVSHSDTTLSTKLKGKAMKLDLLPLLQNDHDYKFAKNVLPSLLLWYGNEGNVWSISEEDIIHVLKAIIRVVYPMFDRFDEIHHGMAIYGLTIQRLTHWWHNFASTAVVLILDFFKENTDLNIETFCDILLEDQAFAYEDLDTNDSTKAFRSSLVLELLGTVHLQQVDGWVDVPALQLVEKQVCGIKGALAMSTAVLEHAIKVKRQGCSEDPHSLSKASGKESSATSQFSQLNWGEKTSFYLASISNRDAHALQEIVSIARDMCAGNDLLVNNANNECGSLDLMPRGTIFHQAANPKCYSLTPPSSTQFAVSATLRSSRKATKKFQKRNEICLKKLEDTFHTLGNIGSKSNQKVNRKCEKQPCTFPDAAHWERQQRRLRHSWKVLQIFSTTLAKGSELRRS
ncbi:hypothetical protein EDC04DRAFT_2977780 [Pisolithus marmoratus]|nr:hypothetical protein EDC04DRAFT_2977780 [Pisolithus marmoratus]